MDRGQLGFDNFGLHLAAVAGDDDGVRRAIESGADVNALDGTGRTSIMCAVAGEHWQDIDASSNASFMTTKRLNAIKLLVAHPDVSLYTLNAPQASVNGVIPLGMAAWLNMADVIRVLLEDSTDTVSVDGMDSHGATALMYAARDGNLEVVRLLLSHGARPDFRDCNHRTSVQFALRHPQTLWLCETALRRHRSQESESMNRSKLFSDPEHLLTLVKSSLPSSDIFEPPPPTVFGNEATSRLTNTLVSSILNCDLTFLHSLLFSPPLPPSSPPALYPMSCPVLVNLPDSKGWSPIHHCVATTLPNIDVLDALYCAGADVSLFTTNEHFTPLHVLAQWAGLPVDHPDPSMSLYQFTVHLIHDLHAPLSARDRNEETCIHVAAEHGDCIDLLMILLECDTAGTVRELRNSRGLTAFEVARPEFRAAFGKDAEKYRCNSPHSSSLTVRPTESFTTLATFSEFNGSGASPQDDAESLYAPSDFDMDASAHHLLANLRLTSPSTQHQAEVAHLNHLNGILEESTQLSSTILRHSRSRIREASKELQELRIHSDKVSHLLDVVFEAVNTKLDARGLDPIAPRRRHRDSEDSQATAVYTQSEEGHYMTWSTMQHSIAHSDAMDDDHLSVSTQTCSTDAKTRSISASQSLPFWFANLAEVERELAHHQKRMGLLSVDRIDTLYSVKDLKLKQILKKKKKVEDKIRELEVESRAEKKDLMATGTAKLKAWIKRKIAPEHKHVRMEIVMDVDEDSCSVGREVKVSWDMSHGHSLSDLPHNEFEASIDDALRKSHVVLDAAKQDLLAIYSCLSTAEQFINLADYSTSRADRVIRRAIKKRDVTIRALRTSSSSDDSDDGLLKRHEAGSPGLLGYATLRSIRPSTSLLSIRSQRSSHVSVAVTLTDHEDEDARTIRRLLLRKVEEGISGAWDEMDKVMSWLRIVKEVIRGVKRRAYL